jgi:coenzyme PQQ synthesis protein D (PqqD)
MTKNDVFRVNSPRVIFENIDGELILVHMEKGAYYTTDEVGAAVWELIESRFTLAEILEALAAHFDAGPEQIETATDAFLRRLMEEDLIAREGPAGDRTPPRRPLPIAKRPFHAPDLLAYQDMQDMLALDPIHDVEATGWPMPRQDDDATSITSRSA